MNSFLYISNDELELIIQNTADKLNLSTAIIEKDLWVCIILNYLFSFFKYKESIVFKGGTSLSKVYNLIERFSEDIDLALDWKVLGYDQLEPYETRSNTKQIQFNKRINDDTKTFLRNEFLIHLKEDFKSLIKDKSYNFYIDPLDEQTICFDYPKNHHDDSILQVIRLEIGCLAEPIPSSRKKIKSYIEQVYSDIFNENIEVTVVDSLRTFFEKLTILHREANRVNGNYPPRYSRHYYDIYKMILTDLRELSLNNINLLLSVVEFKKKFYACNWAKYDAITNGNIKLTPSIDGINAFSKDYDKMKNMLFKEPVSFDTIIKEIKIYESLLNIAIRKYLLNS